MVVFISLACFHLAMRKLKLHVSDDASGRQQASDLVAKCSFSPSCRAALLIMACYEASSGAGCCCRGVFRAVQSATTSEQGFTAHRNAVYAEYK